MLSVSAGVWCGHRHQLQKNWSGMHFQDYLHIKANYRIQPRYLIHVYELFFLAIPKNIYNRENLLNYFLDQNRTLPKLTKLKSSGFSSFWNKREFIVLKKKKNQLKLQCATPGGNNVQYSGMGSDEILSSERNSRILHQEFPSLISNITASFACLMLSSTNAV